MENQNTENKSIFTGFCFGFCLAFFWFPSDLAPKESLRLPTGQAYTVDSAFTRLNFREILVGEKFRKRKNFDITKNNTENRMKQEIRKNNKNLTIKLSVPLKTRRYNPYDESENDE